MEMSNDDDDDDDDENAPENTLCILCTKTAYPDDYVCMWLCVCVCSSGIYT